MAVLGIDTSNYTTSVALFSDDGSYISKRRLLPVKPGERGLRQSDAVFHHTKAYGELLGELFSEAPGEKITAVGASLTPTTEKGSYMPCFLVGESFAKGLSFANNIPFYGFSHQQGHIAAALLSANKTELLDERFIAFHVSGGTTDAVLCEKKGDSLISVTPLSSSNDLKAGQAVDRIGVKMGLSFPCGKELEKLALNSVRDYKNKIKLYDAFCSLSGLENKCEKMLSAGETHEDTAKFLLSYIADTLSKMTEELLKKYGDLPVIFAGGVMSNSIIRAVLQSRFNVFFASPELSSDNAVGTAFLTSLEGFK